MEKKIEIFEHTLLKLLIRRGTNAERKTITLTKGELGYTIDTKRIFIGDGITVGGTLVGNNYLGSSTDITSLNGEEGDLAFHESLKGLYTIINGNGSDVSDWKLIATIGMGGIPLIGDPGYDEYDTFIEAENDSIVITPNEGANTHYIKLGLVHAGNVSGDAVGQNIIIDGSGRISWDPQLTYTTLAIGEITLYGDTHLTLPQTLNIGGVEYTWPSIAGAGLLSSDASGDLIWQSQAVEGATLAVGSGLQIFKNNVDYGFGPVSITNNNIRVEFDNSGSVSADEKGQKVYFGVNAKQTVSGIPSGVQIVKVTLTGAGYSRNGGSQGGAGASVIAYVKTLNQSLWIQTNIGKGDGGDGNSTLWVGNTLVATAGGANISNLGGIPTCLTSSTYISGDPLLIDGAKGCPNVNDSDEETVGAAGIWGGGPSFGGSACHVKGSSSKVPDVDIVSGSNHNGVIIIEW